MNSRAVTLLTIDDEAPIRRSIRVFFEDLGFTVFEAADGRAGLDLFREKGPDIVLVDLRMPGMGGLEVIGTLAAESAETPVIVISGTGWIADAIEAIRAGAWDYVNKPIADMAELELVVGNALEKARLRRESRIYHEKLELQVKARTRELQLLNDMGKDIGADLSVDSAVNTALRYALDAFEPDAALLFLRSGADLVLKGLAPQEAFHGRDLPPHRLGHCLCGLAMSAGLALFSNDIGNDPRCTHTECKQAGFTGFAALPLIGGNTSVGVLGLASRGFRDFVTQAAFLEAFGHTVAIGVKNAILYEKAQSDAAELQRRLVQIQQAEAEKEHLLGQLHQSQKMQAIGTLAGGIAHDFNNILTPIIMGTEMALFGLPEDNQSHPLIKKVLSGALRAKDLVQQILTFSRQSDLEKKPLRLIALVEESIKLARASLPSTIELQIDLPPVNDTIVANPTQIHQVMMNLYANAAHAMGKNGGTLRIRVADCLVDQSMASRLTELSPGRFVVTTIEDTGCGMDAGTMGRIFDPFFTTKPRGEGTGMGLAIVHGIVKSAGGAITVTSQLGRGTTFTIYLPAAIELDEAVQAAPQTIPRGSESLLLVDDEPDIVEIIGQILTHLGYRVKSRTSPLDALKDFGQASDAFDLVITDMTMPKMTGDKLAAALIKIRPDIPIVLCTGFSEHLGENTARQLGIRAVLMKPVASKDLAVKLRQVLDGR